MGSTPPVKTFAEEAWITKFERPLQGSALGRLAGLTFAAKDNIDVKGVPTTAACPEFAYTPSEHATAVNKLLGRGAALLGKTNLDQFACGLNGTRSPYGAVPNAINGDYVCGGSSAGSAYVVATGQVDFSLGTDTAGSGRVPAGLNNIVGLKPTKGLISTYGVLPAARSVDSVSIFARDIQTAWLVLTQAAGFDPKDPYSRSLDLISRPIGQRFRFGVPDTLEFFGDNHAQKEFQGSIKRLESLGGELVYVDYKPLKEAASLLYESALLSERLEPVDSFFTKNPESVIEPVRSLFRAGSKYSGVEVFEAQTELKRLARLAETMWTAIDILVVPTAPTIYTISEMLANPIELNRRLGYYTNFVNLLDYCALSIPSSIREDGLAFGITLIGETACDFQLAELGLRFQRQRSQSDTQVAGMTTESVLEPIPFTQKPSTLIAVVGAHLSGMPLNYQLVERGARLIKKTKTAPEYKLFALANTTPPKPGLLRVAEGGSAIEIEIWEIPLHEYGSFVSLIPSPLGIGQLKTAADEMVQGFLCEPIGLNMAQDISAYGGWRSYIASLSKPC